MKSLKNQIVAPLLVALALTTSTCATQVTPAVSAIPVAAAAEPPVLKIVATDHHYMLPSQIKAGYINMVMENTGKEPQCEEHMHLGMIMPFSVE